MRCVSVIILTWNGRAYLKECLDALAAQTFRDFETILVDNGSSDGSAEYVRDNFPWVRLLELPENTGFAEGNNRGLALAQGTYIVALNNDTKVAPDFLQEMVQAVQSDGQIGMAAAKMMNYYAPRIIDCAGLKISLNGLGYSIGIDEPDNGQYDHVDLFGPCGGAALYRRSMLDEIGFFDPDFFAYYEDYDLAWRARLAGWKAVSASRALVYHVHSATGGMMSPFKIYHTHRNKWFVIIKNWPMKLLVRYLPMVLCLDSASLGLAVLRGKGGPALRARLDFLRSVGSLLRKRHDIQKRRRLSDDQVLSLFSGNEHPVRTFLRKMGIRQHGRQ
jgi:GT2 family glycosyltransferase